MRAFPCLLVTCSLAFIACGGGSFDGRNGAGTGGSGGTGGSSGTASATGGGTSTGGSPTGTRPHPLYPPLDLDTLPGSGSVLAGAYEPPTVPASTRVVTLTNASGVAAAIATECAIPNTTVVVPSSAGHIGTLDLGNVNDCTIDLGTGVIADLVYVGHLPGPQVAPSHRVRIHGGQIGSIMVDPGSSDITFDGVTVNNAVVPSGQRAGAAIYLIDDGQTYVNRFAFVSSIVRMVATLPDATGSTSGCAYLAGMARNVFFANDNIVTAGNNNAWGFRISGGDNFIAVDNTVRVAHHKLIRMNDGPVDYVVVRGGLWLREDSTTSGGPPLNDSFAQLGDLGTDHVYIQDTSVYLLSPEPVSFGASFGPGQIGKSWEARRIAWHARSEAVVSDTLLSNASNACSQGAICDYGVGTHTYEYDPNIAFPSSPWRALPEIADDNPDNLPIEP